MQDDLEEINWFRISFYTVLAFAFFFFVKFQWPDAQVYMPPSIPIIAFIVFSTSFMKSVIWKSVALGHHVTVNGVSLSIRGRPRLVRDRVMGKNFTWAVFSLGYAERPIPHDLKLATLCLPSDQVYEVGGNYVALTLCPLANFGQLPYHLASDLKKYSHIYNLDRIYWGKYSVPFIDRSGNEEDLNRQIQVLNGIVNTQEKMLHHDFGQMEEVKELADRMNKNPSLIKRLTRKIKEDDDD